LTFNSARIIEKKRNKSVFYFSRRTFEITHEDENAKTAVKRFSCFISVLFQLCQHLTNRLSNVDNCRPSERAAALNLSGCSDRGVQHGKQAVAATRQSSEQQLQRLKEGNISRR